MKEYNQNAKQIVNILDTLLEASDHLFTLAKNKNHKDSIFLFTTIVETYQVVSNHLLLDQTMKSSCEGHIINLGKTINSIAKQLEKRKFLKINELLQFSFNPEIKKIKTALLTIYSNHTDLVNKSVSIGVYLCQRNPREAYPEKRIQALVNESNKRNLTIFFFSSKDVDFEREKIAGEVFQNGEWKVKQFPFPDVIHNIFPQAKAIQSKTEKRLRKMIPFTTYGVGDKFYSAKKLVEARKFAHLLVPFKITTDEFIVKKFIEENKIVVLKPIRGRQGQNIYFVDKRKSHYILTEHKKKQSLSPSEFNEWLQTVILKNKNSYMVQKYIKSRTKEGEPFDIRAHVQKDGEGKWQITKIYPRIGNRKSILSNISRGGRADELTSFLSEEFGNAGEKHEQELSRMSLELAHHVDQLYGMAIDELGIDLAIDENGRYWLHEVNGGPQSTYHEEERAVRTIAYTEYIAKNRLFFTNEFEQYKRKGQFNAKHTDLPRASLNHEVKIGMLVGKNSESDKFLEACAYVAVMEKVDLFYFTPTDIDYDEMLIKGYFYMNGEWTPQVVEYPDVIYDRLRMRGFKKFNGIYDELDGIPFTNEFMGDSISKLEVYDKLKETGELENVMIPYQKIERTKDVFHYIDKYEKVIVKPEKGSFAKGVHYIEKIAAGSYLLVEGESERELIQVQLTHYLEDLLKKGSFLVQKYIETRTIDDHPFDIRAHMMKDGNGDWSIVTIYPRVGMRRATITVMKEGGYIGEIKGFLKRNFKTDVDELNEKIKEWSLKVSQIFETTYNHYMNELGIDFAMDKNRDLFLVEVNVNKPGNTYLEFETAKKGIGYAKYVFFNSSNENL